MAYALPLGAALLSVPFYIHLLGAPRYGALVLILAISNYASFLDLGFGKASAYFLAKVPPDPTENTSGGYYFTALIVCGAISFAVSLLGCLSASWLTDLLPSIHGAPRREMLGSVLFACATVPAMALLTFLTGAYQGLHQFHRLSAILAGGGVATQVLPLVACVILGARLDIALGAVLVVRALQVLVLIIALSRILPWQSSYLALQPLRQLIDFGRWPALLNLLSALLNTGDRTVISGVAGPSALAAYSVPFDLTNRLMIVSGSVSNTIFPLFVRDEKSISERVRRTRDAMLGLLTPIVVTVILLLHPFLELWVGYAIADKARMVGEIIICGVWLSAITSLSHSRLLAEKRGRAITANYAAQLLPFFAGVYFATQFFGLIGCAIVWSLRSAIDAIVLIWMARDGEGLARPLCVYGGVLLLALTVAGTTTTLTYRAVALAILLAISLFVARRQIGLVIARFLSP